MVLREPRGIASCVGDVDVMEAMLDAVDRSVGSVEAVILPGSDYPVAYAVGASIELVLDVDTGKVLVTRGRGMVRLGYLVGPSATKMAECIELGHNCSGLIESVGIGPAGKVLRIKLQV